MRLSREKIVRISHQITDVLVSSDDVEFVEDRDTIRQQVVLILTTTLHEEEKADLEVRKKITSQKNGTSSTASITLMSFAAWALPPLLTIATADARNLICLLAVD
jgi:hypothetical protein